MHTIIQTESLSKQYKDVLAVDSVDLEVKQGEIYGFLGLNGAGKTTTIRMLLGMIRPTGGMAYLFGEKVGPGKTNLWNKVGQMVEIPYSYPELTVRENLEILRRLRSIENESFINDTIEKLYLNRYQNIKVRNLSLGNMQRLGIAKALIHRPRLLILDEPANGLDPAGIVQIREMLCDLAANNGVTIFVSSHILDEISRLATRIGIIHNGRLIRESDTEELKNSRTRVLHICTLDNHKAFKVLKKNAYSPVQIKNGVIEVQDVRSIRHPEIISQMLVAEGLPPTKIALEEEDLEHYFFRIIQNQNQP
jgi:ABC-2 type transport system ATP-binding protein